MDKAMLRGWFVMAVLAGAVAMQAVLRRPFVAELKELRKDVAEIQAERDSLKRELHWFRQYLQPEIDSISQRTGDSTLTRAIIVTALRRGVPPRLLAALARIESNYTVGALGRDGEKGMLQVIPGYWYRFVLRRCGAWRHGNLWEELCAGAVVLQYYYSTCHGWTCALNKYNTGRMGTRAGARYARAVQTEAAL
jgi:soluble lytic murein transglycosylase-like protein